MSQGNRHSRFGLFRPAGNKRSHGNSHKLELLESRCLLSGTTGDVFRILDTIPASPRESTSYLAPQDYAPFAIDHVSLADRLAAAPLEFTEEAAEPLQLAVPTPGGGFQEFFIVESPIMERELAARYPDIHTYRGIGVDDPSASIRLDLTPLGFHASVRQADGSYYIDPYYHLDTSVYVSYLTSTARIDATTAVAREAQSEQLFDRFGNEIDLASDAAVFDDHQDNASLDLADSVEHSDTDGNGPPLSLLQGETLRTFRLANAATVEYTNFHGGTKAAGQAAIVTAINRVNQVYENDVAVRMVLVANNDSVVYTGSTGSDPYTNGNGFAMLSQNQSNLDAVIGSANYDIGHVFSTGGGGVAALGVVGFNGVKAQGVTGRFSPINDPFYIDYVAHEMGHQYDALHTFNGTGGSCNGNRSSSAAYEPGSGSTIMAYAGICGADDLQSNSDAYFHFKSLQEITSFLNSIPGTGTSFGTGNTGPTANAGPNFAIPTGTPFRLTGSGTDIDGDTLTYTWEQADLGPARTLAAGDNGTSPIIRSRLGTTDPTRTVPRLQNLLNNTFAPGEILPTAPRQLDFRLTVRDNSLGGGGYALDSMFINVVNTGAAFQVTSPNTSGISWTGNTTQTVTWNVAGSNAGAINTPNVNILLSTNGGISYPITLAAAVPNDGSQTIVVPNIATNQARVMVEGAGNIFFDISNFNLAIVAGTLTGDYNGDGELDCADVDELSTAIAAGSTNPIYDLTGDGSVNSDDLMEWVVGLKGTLMGDANLDFIVDGGDFLIWNGNKFTSGSAWCSGDFNADGLIDGSDFLIWNAFKFQSPNPIVQVAVDPEMTTSRSGLGPQADSNSSHAILAATPVPAQNVATQQTPPQSFLSHADIPLRRLSRTRLRDNDGGSDRGSIQDVFASYPFS